MELSLNEIASLISTLGFPVFVALYMLITNNKTVAKLAEIIEKNTDGLHELKRAIKGVVKDE